ncbi:hypothetical protein [Lacrimispora sp. JR3]|uniref:hypothetical protein n=1 Tax=Lacrimispora sinapis TaxID=3111456 RepID=UPI00374A8FD1
MRRFIKGCIIAGISCIFIGGGIMAVSAAFGGNLIDVLPDHAARWKEELGNVIQQEFWSDDKFSYEDDPADFADQGEPIYTATGIKELSGVITAGKVVIREDSPGQEITVFCNKDASYYSIEEDDGELKLDSYFGNNYDSGEDLVFTLHIPKDYRFSRVDMSLERSKKIHGRQDTDLVLVADALFADEMNLEAKAGYIRINRGNAGKLTADAEAGVVEFSGTTTGGISAKCQAGAIELQLDGKKEDYDYDLRCKLGTIELGDEGMAAFGSERQIDNGSGKTMDLDCEVGAIEVDFMNQV